MCRKTESTPGCGMGGFTGKGLVLREMLISFKRLGSSAPAVFEFCNGRVICSLL